MERRYEQFNEMTFEAYIKSAIDKSVLKARKRQAMREKLEQSFSTMTDAELHSISHADQGIMQVEQAEPVAQVFRVRKKHPRLWQEAGTSPFLLLRRRNTAKPLPLLTP